MTINSIMRVLVLCSCMLPSVNKAMKVDLSADAKDDQYEFPIKQGSMEKIGPSIMAVATIGCQLLSRGALYNPFHYITNVGYDTLWQTIKQHPVKAAAVAGTTAAGLYGLQYVRTMHQNEGLLQRKGHIARTFLYSSPLVVAGGVAAGIAHSFAGSLAAPLFAASALGLGFAGFTATVIDGSKDSAERDHSEKTTQKGSKIYDANGELLQRNANAFMQDVEKVNPLHRKSFFDENTMTCYDRISNRSGILIIDWNI